MNSEQANQQYQKGLENSWLFKKHFFPIQEKMSMCEVRIITATKQINGFRKSSVLWIFIDGTPDNLFCRNSLDDSFYER
jgi:hypothetical protein